MDTHAPTVADGPVWRREGAMVLMLCLIVFGGYFFRATAITMRGEEPRRAQVAVEMIESGDWIVPREQGDPFLSRPPLQNWLIALCYLVSGERDCFGARLPSLVATLAMVLVIYGYGRTFLTPIGALAAGTAFATFGEILQECRMAETEAVFTLLVSGSLLVWHWGMVRGWPEVLAWSLGYGLMALGMLAKSVQAPVYFLVPVTVFLVLTRQWRRLFSLSHLGGMLVGAAILAAWVVPYWRQLGFEAVRAIWTSDVGQRMVEWDGFLTHFVQFPLELFGCMLPWSPLLLAFCNRTFRATIGGAWPQVLLMAIVLVVGVPTCWIPAHGRTRFLLPLYPCAAVLVGFVAQRCSEAALDSPLGIGWRRYLKVSAGLMVVAAVAILAVAWLPSSAAIIRAWAEPPLTAASFCILLLGLAWLTRNMAAAPGLPQQSLVGILAIAAFMVVLFVGPVINVRVRRGNDVPAAFAALKTELPPDARFVSIGHIHADFPFFYRQQVKPLAISGPLKIAEGEYFCFNAYKTARPTLPFAWQEVKAISVDRNKQEIPVDMLVIGRRVASHSQR